MKVLLVDDKESVVTGISRHVPWERLGVTEVRTALDGREALEVQSEFHADLIITDIKMPNMSGIELMQRLYDSERRIRFIVLSGYEEFDYAKQALTLGASEYVLKPVDIHALTAIIEKVLGDLRKQREQDEQRMRFQEKIRRSLPALRQQYLSSMLFFRHQHNRSLRDQWEFAEIPLKPQCFGLLAISIDRFEELSLQPVEEVELSRFIVENIIGDCIPMWGRGISFYSEWGILTVLLNYDPAQPEKQTKEALLKFGELCRAAIEEHSDMTVTVGVSSLCRELTGLSEAYRQASEAVEHAYFFGNNQIVHYEDLQRYGLNPTAYPVRAEQELVMSVRRGQTELTEEAVRVFFDALGEDEIPPHEIRLSCIQLLTVLHRLLLDMGIYEQFPGEFKRSWFETCETANMTELKRNVTNWFAEAADRVRHIVSASSKNIIEQAKEYIAEHLLASVTLPAVADHVGVSPNYLSGLFKKETGSTFMEFLTQRKMEQATVWLTDPNVPIYEIAERLGYHDRRYFRETFKKKTGMTPSEYRDSRLGTVSPSSEE